ncbi:MAG: hypothetical protein NC206_00720 [Bacteroides sp.]|nr:hypothetical protein [Roseburia sp.]MCM1345597.1 hypothetical protein [Bacteroides sp.]MCM1420768.1 hypothetical protein [Bacteroides sp.]
MENQFESRIKEDLHQYLVQAGVADKHLPECQDVEEKWPELGQAYIPDGIREFAHYPTVSLGWMMFVGMAIAKYWDTDWTTYSQQTGMYEAIRDVRGYDCMDEHILEDILCLDNSQCQRISNIVAECAARVNNALHHEHIEPGTPEAFRAYVSCLHQLYLMGMAMQLRSMGYHMRKME